MTDDPDTIIATVRHYGIDSPSLPFALARLSAERDEVVEAVLELDRYATWSALNRPEYPRLRAAIDALRAKREGQGLVEYALILALIVIVAVVALTFLGGALQTLLSGIGESI